MCAPRPRWRCPDGGDVADREPPGLPPWNWRELTDAERRVELEDLADWVAELQEAYGRWVRLPSCWPCHRGLRDELAAFWYWRRRLDEAPDAPAEEAVRWFQSLRVSAQAWAEAYGGCRHSTLGEVDERRTARAAERKAVGKFLELALGEGSEVDGT